MTPEQWQETEWLQQAKANVVLASTAPTCNNKVLGYLVCSAGVAPMVRGAGQDEAVPWGDHRGIIARVCRSPKAVKVAKLQTPLKIPEPTQEGITWREAVEMATKETRATPGQYKAAEQASHPRAAEKDLLEYQLRLWIGSLEGEALSNTEVAKEDGPKYLGRDKGLRIKKNDFGEAQGQ